MGVSAPVKWPAASGSWYTFSTDKRGLCAMTIVVGERLRNKLTRDLFKITKIENEKVVMLEDEKGLVRIWFPRQHLGSFFEEVKGM
jgi:hypothetical protein